VNGWGWVLLGYGVVAGALVAYTWSLVLRSRAVRVRLEELE
jgi:hypothetical protein